MSDTGQQTDQDVPMSRRGRRAFTISSVVVAIVLAVALGYSVVRDPGPQPPIPPEITGTDDGSLKRAIVHYVGAVATRDVDSVIDVIDYDTVRGRALAQAIVDDFGEVAQTKATVTVVHDGRGEGDEKLEAATVHWSDGRTQEVEFVQQPGERSWEPVPGTDRPLSDDPPVPGSPPSATGID